ncbi:globin domain-containing protein [Halomonas sp. WWR20]
MLTPDQERIIAATAPLVAENLDTITQRFYPLMFDRYPDVKALFNASHQASGAQPRALAGAVLAYVQLRQDPRDTKALLAPIVSKHIALNIRPDQYPIVGECLLSAVAEVLGDAVTVDVADAWGALYQELAGLLIELEDHRYLEFASRPGGWRGTRGFHVAETVDESCMIRSFVLAPEDGEAVADFMPGQFVGLKLSIDGEPAYRHYSLSASPNGRTYRISVRRDAQGKASRYLHDRLQVGDRIELLPPAGELVLDDSEAPLLLLSGGVGQTPLLPLARQALGQGRQVSYLHAALDGRHRAFAEEIETLKGRYPELLTAVSIYERPQGEDTPEHVGLVTPELISLYLPGGSPQVYFVGPQGFMSCIDDALEALGIPPAQRHYEHFGPARPLH